MIEQDFGDDFLMKNLNIYVCVISWNNKLWNYNQFALFQIEECVRGCGSLFYWQMCIAMITVGGILLYFSII